MIHLFSRNGSFGENTTSLSGAVSYKGRRKQAWTLISTMTKSQLNAICEVLINICFGNIAVSEKDKKKLQRKKNAIVQLISKTTGANVRKALIEKEFALILMIIKSILSKIKSFV